MKKPSKTKFGIAGLIIAGVVSACVGAFLLVHPVPYFSMGGVGSHAATPVISVFAGNDSAFIGCLLLFMGCFILTLAYRIRNP
jgi:uncharacterized membrane protein YeaQ/YmgE (transglycosylase-associated protein family)